MPPTPPVWCRCFWETEQLESKGVRGCPAPLPWTQWGGGIQLVNDLHLIPPVVAHWVLGVVGKGRQWGGEFLGRKLKRNSPGDLCVMDILVLKGIIAWESRQSQRTSHKKDRFGDWTQNPKGARGDTGVCELVSMFHRLFGDCAPPHLSAP